MKSISIDNYIHNPFLIYCLTDINYTFLCQLIYKEHFRAMPFQVYLQISFDVN